MELFVPGTGQGVGTEQTLSSFPFSPQEGNLKTMHITKYYCSPRGWRHWNSSDAVIRTNGELPGKGKKGDDCS